MRLIVLAAGQDNLLDGMIKCLIRHPANGKTVLDWVSESASGMEVTVVVGYRAIEIMERYPNFRYIVNPDWAVTNNAYSLSLAIDESPCIVMPGDIFVNSDTIDCLLDCAPDCALSMKRENRSSSAINAKVVQGIIREIYTGPLHDIEDEVLVGLYKISSKSLLRSWQQNGFARSNLFSGKTLPLDDSSAPVKACRPTTSCAFSEINTVDDYIRLMGLCN